ncbi:Ent-kaurenoic acid oxidase 1 [Acorus gramineus]|uniref:Ent-kaurenoic acid oxidase 1 n=1 Tax=Acorus gramineus TaxID=55184 RepID=A0AAV9AHJ5_ACOGR|nr:Ent-kaurenoic acid oxidase 1 [Acorus gramineus]
MGVPFFRDKLSFLWFFKIVGRPDDFIRAKKERYGEGVGMYKSHLFGEPSIIE